jgi:hypothetical protein
MGIITLMGGINVLVWYKCNKENHIGEIGDGAQESDRMINDTRLVLSTSNINSKE